MNRFDRARDVLAAAIRAGVFPGCAAEAGSSRAADWQDALGALTYGLDAPAAGAASVYDLASLTKPIVTATVAMRLVESGALALDDAVADRERAWRGAGKASVTIRDLLEHASGLPAWAPLWRQARGAALVEAAAATPLEYEPRSRSVYSDLGFIVLGAILERAGGAGLDRLFEPVSGALSDEAGAAPELTFHPPAKWRSRIAPTRFAESRDRLLVGEVDDDNAWALGGVSGHAGAFGTAAAVGAFARALMRALAGDAPSGAAVAAPETIRAFLAPSRVPGSSRALGWDLMRPASSCGSRMSEAAFGHTGFTGTSIWIDPARDRYAVLLANRVHPDAGPVEAIQEVRRAFHDALAGASEA